MSSSGVAGAGMGAAALADGGEELDSARAKPKKAPNAFRTISEVADDLHIPQHVLRFWETKFPQVKPLKRGGGRRYYRPDDISLLRRISDLLYIQGYTIKGVQRLLRDGGGRLSDDIPPAAPEDREEAGLEPQLLMPGLLPVAKPASGRTMAPPAGGPPAGGPSAGGSMPARPVPEPAAPARVAAEAAAAPGAEVAAPQGGSGRSVPAAGPAASPSAAEAELARLRGEMQAVLRELEALRALLD